MRRDHACLYMALMPWLLLADPSVVNAPATTAPDVVSAQQRLRLAPRLTLTPWASEPLVQNITSVSFDAQGHAFVVESGRRRTSVFDIRGLGPWLDDDFALRTEPERAAFLRRVLTPGFSDYPAFLEVVNKGGRGGFQDFNRDGVIDWKDLQVEEERIRRVVDSNQDGTADTSEVFAGGFNGITSGVAAGVLAEGTNLWFTCIPDLWRFPIQPKPNAVQVTNAPAVGERVASGFGVHIAFGGHDLHGLIRGPDGRIYFSIADRGAQITNREGRVLSLPDCGAIYRCETDGSRLEIVAKGLRNPQELAFDDHGNLWTGDNNGDGGDKARWTWVLPGADYGWTMGWQWLPKMGAWNSERLWQLRGTNTAAYIVPPVAHIGHGPAGIAYYPGTGLDDSFKGHFFYADFPGGIRTFQVEPDGGFFRIASPPGAGSHPNWLEDNSGAVLTGKLLWDLSPVDVTFPPFGGVIVADWVQGWEKTGKGRLWHITHPSANREGAVTEVQRILTTGISRASASELVAWLGHPDQRVRLESQWALAARGWDVAGDFLRVALGSTNTLARLHALWGLEQVARQSSVPTHVTEFTRLLPLLSDAEPEVRAQTAYVLGEVRLAAAQRALLTTLEDRNERVAALATLAWSRLLSNTDGSHRRVRYDRPWNERAYEKSVALLPEELQRALPEPTFAGTLTLEFAPLRRMLVRSGFTNPALLHSGSRVYEVALKTMHDWQRYIATPVLADTNPAVRLALLLAERRLGAPEVASFLKDPEPQLVLEAARAINDTPIPEALPQLAAMLEDARVSATTNLTSAGAPIPPWPAGSPYSRDEWRTWVLRRAANAAFQLGTADQAVRLVRLAVDASAVESVRVEAMELLGDWPNPPRRDRIVGLHRSLPARSAAPVVEALTPLWTSLVESNAPPALLLAMIRTGDQLSLPAMDATLQRLGMHADPAVRESALRTSSMRHPSSLAALQQQLDSQVQMQQKSALAQLKFHPDAAATALLKPWVESLASGTVPEPLRLDVLEAASKRAAAEFRKPLQQFTNTMATNTPLGLRQLVLSGGDASQGRRLFTERADWGCQRCHKLQGEGGDVGPELKGLGRSKGRAYVLNAILNPNAEIAQGFESVMLELKSGESLLGVLKEETATTLSIIIPGAGTERIQKTDVTNRQRGPSAMPDGLGDLMTLGELRDLLEALSE